MPVAITSTRGQIVIPREIRKQLNIVPGKKVLIRAEEIGQFSSLYRMTLWNSSAVSFRKGHHIPGHF